MSITPSPVPRPEGEMGTETPPQPPVSAGGGEPPRRSWTLLAVLFVACLGALGYYSYQLTNRLEEMQRKFDATATSQNEILQALHQRMEENDERYAELQGEFSVTKDRLGLTQNELQRARQISLELAQRQREAATQLASQINQLSQEQTATKGTVGSLTTDVAGVRSEVETTKEDLESTRSELQRVIGDLGVQSDLIAHNRTELADLRLRGERDYFEFDLQKRSRIQRIGGIALELKKTDVKRQKYTINLIADDRTIEKKDKTTHEPVQFYRPGSRYPTEIVVNQIYKDRIVGYVSAPKPSPQQDGRTPMSAAS